MAESLLDLDRAMDELKEELIKDMFEDIRRKMESTLKEEPVE